MVNSTVFGSNMTQESNNSNKFNDIVRLFFVVLLLFCLIFFLYFISVLLAIFFTTPHVRENARYVLFAHMLINDGLYMLMSIFLMLFSVYLIYLPMPFCFIIRSLATSTFRITPYNLAAMSLERYAAVCHPLRHGELCTAQSALHAISVIWGVGLIPNLADLITLVITSPPNFISVNLICLRARIITHPFQNTIKLYSYILSFSIVGLIIVYTYARVMMVARKAGSDKAAASKAGKTVMLHAVQLSLCMFSFVSTLTETYIKDYVTLVLFFNFLMFTCVPRFLSPFIYGLRDEFFHKYIKKMYIKRH